MVETTETTAEQLYEYDKVEYLFGSMLLDPRVQHYFGADDRIASNPDTNPITITTQYILYAFEENEPTLENIRQLGYGSLWRPNHVHGRIGMPRVHRF